MARRADWDNDDDFEILNPTISSKTAETFEWLAADSFKTVPFSSQISSNPIPVIITKPTVNAVQQSPTTSTYYPIRYGSAAIIPYEENFDFKSLLIPRSYLPNPSNDLLNILQTTKSKTTPVPNENHLQQILIENAHHRQSLIQFAKQAQQDFVNAIQLD